MEAFDMHVIVKTFCVRAGIVLHILTHITTGTPINSHDLEPSLVTSMPQHQLTQWQGGCKNDCYKDINWFCGLGPDDTRCHECSIFCGKDDFDEKMCRKECRALYDRDYPPPPPPEPISTQQPTLGTTETTPAATISTDSEELEASSIMSTESRNNPEGTINPPYDITAASKVSWLWIVGGVSFAVPTIGVVILLIFLRKKYKCLNKQEPQDNDKPQIPPPSPPPSPAPEVKPLPTPKQCSEDHARGPLYYICRYCNQRGLRSCIHNAPESIANSSSSSTQNITPEEIPLMALNTDHDSQSDRQDPIGSPTSSTTIGSNDKILPSGAEDSIAFSGDLTASPL